MGPQGAKNRYEGLANHQRGFAKPPQKALLLFGDPEEKPKKALPLFGDFLVFFKYAVGYAFNAGSRFLLTFRLAFTYIVL